jgi:hypothetical protein
LRIADLTTPIPGGGNFSAFNALALTAFPGDPVRVAFTALGAAQAGVYLYDSANAANPLRQVANLSTRIPDGTGTFTSFSAVSLSARHTAFLGLGGGGQQGIYLASSLSKVIAKGDKIGGKTVTALRMGGNQGLAIFASGYPKSQRIACDSAAPVDGIEETVSAGSSSLTYNAGTGRYIYVWKTKKAWAKTCRQLVLKLDDGTEHRANFWFR